MNNQLAFEVQSRQITPGELKKHFLEAVVLLSQDEQKELWNYLNTIGIISEI